MTPRDIGEIGKNALDVAELKHAEQLAKKDEYIINALVKISTYKNFPHESPAPNWPTIFGLVWGESMVSHSGFPDELQSVVSAILAEEIKRQDANDFYEKQVHGIILDLLQVMYEIQVNTLVKRMKKDAGLK